MQTILASGLCLPELMASRTMRRNHTYASNGHCIASSAILDEAHKPGDRDHFHEDPKHENGRSFHADPE